MEQITNYFKNLDWKEALLGLGVAGAAMSVFGFVKDWFMSDEEEQGFFSGIIGGIATLAVGVGAFMLSNHTKFAQQIGTGIGDWSDDRNLSREDVGQLTPDNIANRIPNLTDADKQQIINSLQAFKEADGTLVDAGNKKFGQLENLLETRHGFTVEDRTPAQGM